MSVNPVVFVSDCRISNARAQHDALRRAFIGGGDIKIDASHVEAIDITGLQILASAFKTAKSQNTRLDLIAPSQPLLDALARAGLQLPSSHS